MEKAKVTFKNPENDREINIDFVYDKDTFYLDYNITLSNDYSLTEHLDFNGFLANMFLNMLQSNAEEEIKEDE